MSSRFVRNTRVPEWGIGRVLSERGDLLEVHFEFGGRRKLSQRIASIVDVPEAEIPRDSDVLDPDFGTGRTRRAASPSAKKSEPKTSAPRTRSASDPGVRTRTSAGAVRNPAAVERKSRAGAEAKERFTGSRRFPVLVEKFRDHFPRGLADPLVELEERGTLREVATEFRAVASADARREALTSGVTEDIVDAVTELLERSGLLSPIDITRLKSMPTEAERPFVEALNGLATAGDDLPDALEAAADALAPYDLARWGVLTGLALFLEPTRWTLLRPETMPLVADMLAWDLAWESRPNAYTYRRALLLTAGVRSELQSRGEKVENQLDLAIFFKHAVA